MGDRILSCFAASESSVFLSSAIVSVDASDGDGGDDGDAVGDGAVGDAGVDVDAQRNQSAGNGRQHGHELEDDDNHIRSIRLEDEWCHSRSTTRRPREQSIQPTCVCLSYTTPFHVVARARRIQSSPVQSSPVAWYG